jgi:hypothetical protein
MNPPSPVVTYVAQAHQPPTGRGGAGDAAAASRGGAPRGGAGGAEGGEGDAAERAAAQRPWDGWGASGKGNLKECGLGSLVILN